jgi:uridylate kinase
MDAGGIVADGSGSEGVNQGPRRVLLKLSGEVLTLPGQSGINIEETLKAAAQIKLLVELGVQPAVVVGGGNILRGAQFSSGTTVIKKATAHHMGMLATVMNGLALQEALESLGCETRLQTAIRMESVAEPFIRRRAVRHLEKGRIVILAAGTGNPFVTTDTAAALRSCELGVDILDDPMKNPHAVLYDKLTYDQVLRDNLKVMDASAVSMCRESNVPIRVFSYRREGNIQKAALGQAIGTLISAKA